MTYEILSNKWRPKKFDDVVGQNEAVFILKNSIKQNKLHHCYLINGAPGTGKTTIARIFSKCLNCELEITLTPCDNCNSCKSINTSSSMDTIELDAASKTKVEDIKDLINSSNYTTMYSRFKIYILDEVHMLSNSSFNVLLKTLEEPVKNTKYILITTNINKIPETIISRSINLDLKRISYNEIYSRLIKILETEKIKYNAESIRLIAHFSNGSLRHAINTLEKIIILNDNIINYKYLENFIGIINKKKIYLLIILIHKKKLTKILKLTDLLNENTTDYNKILDQIQIVLHEILIYKLNIKKIKFKKDRIMDIISNALNIKDIQEYYNSISEEKNYIEYSPNIKLGFDFLITKIILKKKS
ncbi:MAG TPA: DNA polymerase III subunit gamma/tau [Candidatus Azoamicus sp. OHIO1]